MTRLSAEQKLWAYRTMVLIRRFEEKSTELYKQNLIGGSLHIYSGEEAVAAGCCAAVRPDDYMTMTYRGRGQMLAKGADPARIMAELLGRASGYCKGKGGPMHLVDLEHGILGANGIVAGGIPIAVGAALSAKVQKTGQIAITFFGDGATNQGAFHEALNLAAIWDLPVVFVCENNLYAEMTPVRDSTRLENLSDRAASYGFPGVTVDGMDVETVYGAAVEAVERARKGLGPTLIEAKTYRYGGHMFGDLETYRTREEVAEWKERDPIQLWKARILADDPDAKSTLARINDEVDRMVEEAAAWALESAEPTAEDLAADLWA